MSECDSSTKMDAAYFLPVRRIYSAAYVLRTELSINLIDQLSVELTADVY